MLSDLKQLVLMVRCVHLSYFLHKGQVIAQATPIPYRIVLQETSLSVYWAEVMGEDKPMIRCGVHRGGEYQYLEGVLDAGGPDVMIIPSQKWPSHWELQDVAGKVQGIEGV